MNAQFNQVFLKFVVFLSESGFSSHPQNLGVTLWVRGPPYEISLVISAIEHPAQNLGMVGLFVLPTSLCVKHFLWDNLG